MKAVPAYIFCVLLALSCGKEGPSDNVHPAPTVPITAGEAYPAVQILVTAVDSTLRLMSVRSSDLDTAGASPSWSFLFATPTLPQKFCYYTAIHGDAWLDHSTTTSPGVGAAFVSHSWMNSSDAARIAEDNGGREFRSLHPGCTVSAGLGEPVVPNPGTYWYFTYRSAAPPQVFLNITVDATTGDVK